MWVLLCPCQAQVVIENRSGFKAATIAEGGKLEDILLRFETVLLKIDDYAITYNDRKK